MESDLIPLHSSNYRREAEMVKSALEANGIPAVVFSDDGGRKEVSLQFVHGAKLWSIQKTRFAQSTSSN